MKDPGQNYLTPEDISARLGLRLALVRSWFESHEFPYFDLPGGVKIVKAPAFDEWLTSREVPAKVDVLKKEHILLSEPVGSKGLLPCTREIAARLKTVRILKGMSTVDLKESCGLKSWQLVARFEKGDRRFDKQEVKTFARSLGIRYEWLADGRGFLTDTGVAHFSISKTLIPQSQHFCWFEEGVRVYLPQLLVGYGECVNFRTLWNVAAYPAGFVGDDALGHEKSYYLFRNASYNERIVLWTDIGKIDAAIRKAVMSSERKRADLGRLNPGAFPVACTEHTGADSDMVAALDRFISQSLDGKEPVWRSPMIREVVGSVERGERLEDFSSC